MLTQNEIRPAIQKPRAGLGLLRRSDAINGWLFVAPVMLHFLIFIAYPACAALYYSFTEWNGRSAPIWVGLQNYQRLFFDQIRYPNFWHSLGVTIQYAIIAVPLSLAAALTLALLVDGVQRGRDFFQAAFYLPVVTAEAVVAVIWRWVYDPLYGLLNGVLAMFGIAGPNWIGNASLVIPALSVIAAWQCGSAMLIFLAGLRGVPSQLYEAAAVDGANANSRFWYITLPMLRPTLFYLIVTGLIGAFQVFGLVYVLFTWSGGPQQSALTFMLSLYSHAFRYSEMGVACAMSFILLGLIIVVTAVQFKLLPQQSD